MVQIRQEQHHREKSCMQTNIGSLCERSLREYLIETSAGP